MKAVTLFSGGKDSFLSTMIAMEHGYDILYGITIIPDEYSMMFHYPNSGISKYPASLLNFEIKYIGEKTFDEYIKSINGVDAIITGAIASDYQKTRIEKICHEEGLMLFSPLWRLDPATILKELLLRGISATVVSVSAEGLNESDLGKEIDNGYVAHLVKVSEKTGINIVGEGGEFETFVTGFCGSAKRISILKSSLEWFGSYGYLNILGAKLTARKINIR